MSGCLKCEDSYLGFLLLPSSESETDSHRSQVAILRHTQDYPSICRLFVVVTESEVM